MFILIDIRLAYSHCAGRWHLPSFLAGSSLSQRAFGDVEFQVWELLWFRRFRGVG